MNKIKVKPYPNFKITEECLERDIIPSSVPYTPNNASELNLNNPTVMINEFIDGAKRVTRPGPPVLSNNEKYFSVFPNPVHLFFDSSINFFNSSEEIKKTNFPFCAQKKKIKMGDIHFLDVDADETHMCYDEFFKLRMNSIIMLSTSVEAFINHSIPNDYPDRENIERYRPFKEKLKTHLPDSLGLIDFWVDKDYLWNQIMNLYYMRNDLIHLKTNSQDGFEAYYEVIRKMLEFDIDRSINAVGKFMNEIQTEFIVFK